MAEQEDAALQLLSPGGAVTGRGSRPSKGRTQQLQDAVTALVKAVTVPGASGTDSLCLAIKEAGCLFSLLPASEQENALSAHKFGEAVKGALPQGKEVRPVVYSPRKQVSVLGGITLAGRGDALQVAALAGVARMLGADQDTFPTRVYATLDTWASRQDSSSKLPDAFTAVKERLVPPGTAQPERPKLPADAPRRTKRSAPSAHPSSVVAARARAPAAPASQRVLELVRALRLLRRVVAALTRDPECPQEREVSNEAQRYRALTAMAAVGGDQEARADETLVGYTLELSSAACRNLLMTVQNGCAQPACCDAQQPEPRAPARRPTFTADMAYGGCAGLIGGLELIGNPTMRCCGAHAAREAPRGESRRRKRSQPCAGKSTARERARGVRRARTLVAFAALAMSRFLGAPLLLLPQRRSCCFVDFPPRSQPVSLRCVGCKLVRRL